MADSPEELLTGLPDEKRADARALVDMFTRLSGHPPRVWSRTMLGFGDHHYRYDSGREGDTFLVGFAPRRSQTVIYEVLGYDPDPDLESRLGRHTRGQGCLYIKRLADVDMAVLEELTRRALAAKGVAPGSTADASARP